MINRAGNLRGFPRAVSVAASSEYQSDLCGITLRFLVDSGP